MQFDLLTIERELARGALRVAFAEPRLEHAYVAEQREQARFHNRITIALLIAVFDGFFIPELRAVPEAITVSAILRFAILTPLTLLYVVLDWRGRTRRWNGAIVTALLIAPTLAVAVEAFWVTSPTALANHQAVPLLQLAILTCRISIRQAALVNACCCLVFIATVLFGHIVPAPIQASLIGTALAIGITTLVFAWRLDLRDRQVFLFTLQARIGRDILARQNRQLAEMSQADALTGLGNRRCFDETMARLWSAAGPSVWPISLILFDIDCFKQFNDALGHQAGDECLKMVARAVVHCLRDGRDTLVRYGGEEFAIVLPAAGLAEARAVAERVRQAIILRALAHPGGGPSDLVTISLGVATVQDATQPVAALIESTDQALYAAKRQGRNRVSCAGDTSSINARGSGEVDTGHPVLFC